MTTTICLRLAMRKGLTSTYMCMIERTEGTEKLFQEQQRRQCGVASLVLIDVDAENKMISGRSLPAASSGGS